MVYIWTKSSCQPIIKTFSECWITSTNVGTYTQAGQWSNSNNDSSLTAEGMFLSEKQFSSHSPCHGYQVDIPDSCIGKCYTARDSRACKICRKLENNKIWCSITFWTANWSFFWNVTPPKETSDPKLADEISMARLFPGSAVVPVVMLSWGFSSKSPLEMTALSWKWRMNT